MAMLLVGTTTVVAACFFSYRAGVRYAAESRARAPRLMLTPRKASGISYFLSGVMGGSGAGSSKLVGIAVESQDYRAQMRDAILAADATADIVDPAQIVEGRAPELHPHGAPIDWSEDAAVGTMFGECVATAANCDVVVSYLPTASMGSAVELHAAYVAGRLILVVAPGEKMKGNWVVRSYADKVFDNVTELQDWLVGAVASDSLKGKVQRPFSSSMATTRPLGGSITFVYSSSLEASRAFYDEGLGLRIRSDKGAVVFYTLPGAAASLGVVREGVSAAVDPPCSARTAGRDTVMICLLSADVDGALKRVLALNIPGVRVEQPATQNERFGIYNALLRDPDGYLVELQAFVDAEEHRRFCGAG